MGNNTNSGCGCTSGGTPHSPKTMANISGGARKKRGTGNKCGTKKAKRGGGIVSTAAAPMALYGLARMAHHTSTNKSRKSRRRTKRRMRGGSVLGNALPSLLLYGLARGMRGTKRNSNRNGNKTRKMRKRSRRGRRM